MLYIFRQFLVLLFFSGLLTSPVDYQVVASFGGRFLGAGFNSDETVLVVAASTGISFYDLTTDSDLPLLNIITFTNIHSAAFSENWVAIAYATSPEEQLVSLIELTSRSIHSETFFTTDGSIEALKFSPDGSRLAILGTGQPNEQGHFLVVKSIDGSALPIEARISDRYRSLQLDWSMDGRFAAATGTQVQDLIIDVETGTELNLDPSAYSASLTALLETLDNAPDDYQQPLTLIICRSARYRIEYQEHGTGTISIIDTTQTNRVYQLNKQFFGNINGLNTNSEDSLFVNFTGDLHCNFDVVLKYERQQLTVDSIIENNCTHGYMVEFFTPFVAIKPSEGETTDPYALAVVKVDETTGLLSEELEERVLIEGHTGEIVYQHWLDNTHLITISQDQTARFWTISDITGILELTDIQVVDLGIDPTSLVLWLDNDHAIIKDQTNHLQIFDFALASASFGEQLQTISPIGGDYLWIVPAPDYSFYTLTEDNVIRLWADVEN